jgi:hypothetical protein
MSESWRSPGLMPWEHRHRGVDAAELVRCCPVCGEDFDDSTLCACEAPRRDDRGAA